MKKQAITLLLILVGFANTFAQSYPEMITVEGGTFTMGDTEMEGEKDEQPTHQVTLKTFKIAKTETTVLQWRDYCDATDTKMPKSPIYGLNDNNPIVNVNYSDAIVLFDRIGEFAPLDNNSAPVFIWLDKNLKMVDLYKSYGITVDLIGEILLEVEQNTKN